MYVPYIVLVTIFIVTSIGVIQSARIANDTSTFIAAVSEANAKGQCSGSKEDAEECSSKYVTHYVLPALPPEVISCRLDPQFIQDVCTGGSQASCQSLIDGIVDNLTAQEGRAQAPAVCEEGKDYSYRGAVACFPSTIAQDSIKQVAAVVASGDQWTCCQEDSSTCRQKLIIAQTSNIIPASLEFETSRFEDVANTNSSVGGGEVISASGAFVDVPQKSFSISSVDGTSDTSVSNMNGTLKADNSVSITADGSKSIGAEARSVRIEGSGAYSNAPLSWETSPLARLPSQNTFQVSDAEPTVTRSGSPEGEQRTQNPEPAEHTRESSPSILEKFLITGSLIDRFANFVTGETVVQRVTTVVPVIETRSQTETSQEVPEIGKEFRKIEEIASDVASQTEPNISRLEHFAQTLERVGGPSKTDTENESFGRIQDLIVEDEAIRALRVAEEEGRRAKDELHCRVLETSESCLERRKEYAKQVERETFVAELEERVLPENAVLHFLAVYDGWIRPTPAPDVYATSTLGVLNTQDEEGFVSWIIDTVSEATANAVEVLSNLISGTEKSVSEGR